MTILGIIGTAIGVVLALMWRLNSAATAVRGLADTAEDARGFWRRWMWRSRLANDPLQLIKDPREAASAMMAAVAEADGAMTEREQAAMLAEMRGHFETTETHVQELLARGRWAVRDVRDLDRCLARLNRQLEDDHREDILGMLDRVAAANGTVAPEVAASLDRFRKALAAARRP